MGVLEIHCEYCNSTENIQEHHLHCRFLDNPGGVGKKIDLCEKCHNILHLQIPTILWREVPKERKEEVIRIIKEFTNSRIRYPYHKPKEGEDANR